MDFKKWPLLILCAACLLVAGCAAEDGSTASGSDEWSRGVIIGTTEADTVAVTAWKGTTFVAWIAESGQLRLAQLDAALGLESVTHLALKVASIYAGDVRLEAEASDRLHLTWEDSIDGIPTLVHARLVPGQAEPAFQQEVPLPTDAHHIETVTRLESDRLEIFWSATSGRNSGIYHRAVSLTGDELAPVARLTETGRQPGVGWGPAGEMHIAWVDDGTGSYVAVWHALFDPESRSLQDPVQVAEVWWKRGMFFQGPAVGSTDTETTMAWNIRRRAHVLRGSEGRSGSFEGGIDPVAPGAQFGGGAWYVVVSSAPAEAASSVHPLTAGEVVGTWGVPRIRTVGDRVWVVFSGLVERHRNVLLQVLVVSFDEEGQSEPVPVTETRSPSHRPDLAVGADGTLRAAWLEAAGDYQIAVASTASEAREALGGFRLTDWWEEIGEIGFEGLSLLFYTPLVVGWVVLPLGLVLVVTLVSHGSPRGWWVLAWLGVAMLLQLVCKRLIAPRLMPLQNPVQIGLSLMPVVLGAGLVWVYWRRTQWPSLLVVYGLFAGVDALFSLFVLIPRVLWAA